MDTRLVTFAELIPGVAAGTWTITTPLFVTEERARHVAFSRPVWSLADGILVRATDAGTLTSYEALAHDERVRVGVIAGQIQEQAALAAGIPPARTLHFATQGEAVAALRQGQIDAYPSVAAAHRGYLQQCSDPTLMTIELVALAPGGKDVLPQLGRIRLHSKIMACKMPWDQELATFLGSTHHRTIMQGYGCTDAEIGHVL